MVVMSILAVCNWYVVLNHVSAKCLVFIYLHTTNYANLYIL